MGSPGSQGILTSPPTQGEKSLPHTMHLSLRIRFPLCWCQTSELTHLCTLARLDQGSPRTVSCAKPQTPTSGNSCTGQVSYPYGPVHHIPGKTVSEVGYKRRKENNSAHRNFSSVSIYLSKLHAGLIKSMLKVLIWNQGKKWFQMRMWLLTWIKRKRLIWTCSQYKKDPGIGFQQDG